MHSLSHADVQASVPGALICGAGRDSRRWPTSEACQTGLASGRLTLGTMLRVEAMAATQTGDTTW